jgi:uncharacterized protein YbjT (DUF2867 family)
MNILLTGASGFIGSHLMRELVARGHNVRACVRHPATSEKRFPGPEYVHCDFSSDVTAEQWESRVEGIDIVINAVGIIRETAAQHFDILHRDAPIALFRAAASAGVRRIIQISALGADASAQSRYHLSKRAADECLTGLPVEWAILLPSIVYGPGAKSMALFRALAALPLTPLVADGQQPIQPIHIDDLVRAVVHCIDEPNTLYTKIDLVGPSPVTMLELLQLHRQWLGLGTLRPLPVSYPVSMRLAGMAGFLGSAPVDRESVQMLQRGNTGDVGAFIDNFRFTPRAIQDVLARTPATTADRWYAGLYFLRPLLRISLALMWILTGLTSAFFYPSEESYALLEKTGITGTMAPLMLYGAAALDLLLGLALLFSIRLRMAASIQIAVMALYSLIITVALPAFWLHPFGPVSKNMPLIVATLILIVMEKR